MAPFVTRDKRSLARPTSPPSILRLSWMAVWVVLVGLLAGCPRKNSHEGDAPRVRIDATRYRVPLFEDEYALGGDAPLVTIVVFTDYACPPCGRTWQVMNNLLEDYGDDLRVVYRSYTVPGFGQGEQAAEAAFAAGAQGKFWEMHRRLFEHAGAFDRPTLRAQAEALGLDVPRFTDDLDTGAHAGLRLRHRREAKRLGIVGLPAMFVNGLYLAGFADEPTWHAVIDEEIAKVREMLAAGTPRPEVYAAIMATASTGRVTPTPAEAEQLQEKLATKQQEDAEPVQRQPPRTDARYRIDVSGAPARGPEDAPIVVIEFIDFQCPYCRRAYEEELERLMTESEDVRWVIKQLPLPIHAAAVGAAKAALAAGRQGKFWEMHDRLLAHEGSMGRLDFVRFAEEIGLDGERFLAELDDPALAKLVDDDIALAELLGIPGTPGFFVNGRYASGYRAGQIAGMIAEEREKAQALMAEGVPRAEVAARLLGEDAIDPRKEPSE